MPALNLSTYIRCLLFTFSESVSFSGHFCGDLFCWLQETSRWYNLSTWFQTFNLSTCLRPRSVSVGRVGASHGNPLSLQARHADPRSSGCLDYPCMRWTMADEGQGMVENSSSSLTPERWSLYIHKTEEAVAYCNGQLVMHSHIWHFLSMSYFY